MRVLVVDDEPDVLLLCRVNFEFAGHEVLEARDGDQALEVAAAEKPDVIVLDIMLPRRDGLAILQELHTSEATKDIPVVLLTAKTQGDDQLRAFKAGADEYVTKPFSPAVLTDTIERVGRMSEQERAEHREQALEHLTGLDDT